MINDWMIWNKDADNHNKRTRFIFVLIKLDVMDKQDLPASLLEYHLSLTNVEDDALEMMTLTEAPGSTGPLASE